MATALTFTTSCSDDDDCNSGIVYSQHSFSKAYSLEEAQNYLTSLSDELFSSANIDTTDFKPLVSDCRYFNDTYLKYKSSDGDAPFDSIMSNLAKFISGDLSDLTATLDRYKRYAGVYTANTSSKSWDKTADKNNSITLNFNDEAGKNIEAKLVWLTFPSESPEGTEGITEDLSAPNIIKVTDKAENVVTDTLPNVIQLTITGGQHNLDLSGFVKLIVSGSVYMEISSGVKYKDYILNSSQTARNSFSEKDTKLVKNDKVLFVKSEKTKGNNFLNYVVDSKTYPVTERLSKSFQIVLDKEKIETEENKLLYRQKINELAASGVKNGSEEYAKQKVAITKETRTCISYDEVNNIYIGSYLPKAYYNENLKVWGTLPSITLNDNTTIYIRDLSKSESTSYLLMSFEELYSRLKSLGVIK